MKKTLSILFALAFLALSLSACAGQPAAAPAQGAAQNAAPAVSAQGQEPVVIRAISQQGEQTKYWSFVEAYCKEVAARSNGMLTIEMVGSTETIAEDEMIFSLQNGIIDMFFDMESLAQLTPMATAMALTNMTTWEEREAGLYDFYREFYAREVNLHWIGKANQPQWWVLCTKAPCPTRASIANMKIRSNAPCAPVVDGLGAVATIIPFSDVYSSLESGVVDGFILCPEDIVRNSLHTQTNYMLSLPLFKGGQSSLLMNMDKWNSLTPEQQGWLQQPFEDLERLYYAFFYYNQMVGEEECMANGLELVTWTEEENAAATEDIRLAVWNSIKDGIPAADAQYFAQAVGLPY